MISRDENQISFTNAILALLAMRSEICPVEFHPDIKVSLLSFILGSNIWHGIFVLQWSIIRIWSAFPTEVCFHESNRDESEILVQLRFSYPYSEEHDEAHSYLRARCPAWCDRILLSHSFRPSIDIEVRESMNDSIGFPINWRVNWSRHIDPPTILSDVMFVLATIRFVFQSEMTAIIGSSFILACLFILHGASGSRLVDWQSRFRKMCYLCSFAHHHQMICVSHVRIVFVLSISSSFAGTRSKQR